MSEWIKMIVFSATASFGFGILFRMERKYYLLAGLGGGFARFVYLLFQVLTTESFVYSFFAAMATAAFAECLASKTKNPTSVFLYPTIIPLIPVVQLYYSGLGLLWQDTSMISEYGVDCIHSLAGVALGFTVISIAVHYARMYQGRKRRQAAEIPFNSNIEVR